VRTFFALCLLTVAVSGCGSAAKDSAKEFKGEQQQVAATVERLETDARADKAANVCTALLSDSLLATLKKQGTNCKTAVKDAIDDADSFDLTVDDVSIAGDKATVKVISGKGSEKKADTLEMARDGSDWKIASLRAAS
jgi:hypothetical protein